MPASDAIRIEPRPFLRMVAGLLNRCPSWVASPTPDQNYLLARSPVGTRYIFQVLSHLSALDSALQDVLSARQAHRAEGVVLILLDQPQGASFSELAQAHGMQLWTLADMDYLVMAADLESNAPLAHLGLHTQQSNTTIAPPPAAAARVDRGL